MPNRPFLSLTEIDDYDPQGPPTRKWCPLCGDGKPKDAAHRSLSIERSTGLWKCFRCGQSGQAREFWQKSEGKNSAHSPSQKRNQIRAAFASGASPNVLPNVLSNVSSNVSLDLPTNSSSSLNPSSNAPAPELDAAPAIPDWKESWEATQLLEGTPGASYLARRGISLPIAELAELRYSAHWSGGKGAVVFPIRAQRGEIVAAQGRAVYGNAKITKGPKKEGAFFAPVLMGSGRRCGPLDGAVPAIVLVEAPIDALSIAMCGFPAMALCGTSGPTWLHIGCGLRAVALAYDADEAGERAAQETAARLKPYGSKCTRLRPEGFKDWNEALVGMGQAQLNDWLAERLLVI
jgi:hypothetical protein